VIPRRVLTIAGSDSGGGAGIQADLKTITVLGGFGMSVVTALTAQNTLGVHGIHEVPLDFIEAQFDAVASDIGVDAAKTGMLATADVIRLVVRKIREYGIEKLVVDPVMIAKGGTPLIRDEAKAPLLAELIPLAFVVTPNVPEAEILAGMKIASLADMEEAARRIHRAGARHVVVKGGHLDRGLGEATDVLYDGWEAHRLASPWIATRDTHGTGCTFSAAIAALLAGGLPLTVAVEQAKRFVSEAISTAPALGSGHGPLNHWQGAKAIR